MCKAYRPCTPTGASFPAAPTSASSQPPGLRPVGSPDAMPSFLGKRLLLSFNPLAGNRSGLQRLAHTTPSADFCRSLGSRLAQLAWVNSLAPTARQISRGKTRYLRCIDAEFTTNGSPRGTKCTPTADGGLRGHVLRNEPARPGCITPHIRFFPSRGIERFIPRGLPSGRRPAASDWTSFRHRLATTPLPFSLPSALRKPGHRTFTDEVTCHARHTRHAHRRAASSASGAAKVRRRIG